MQNCVKPILDPGCMKVNSIRAPFGRRVGVMAVTGTFVLLTAKLLADPSAPSPDSTVQNLRQLSLEELLNLQVSIASKKDERLSDTAAAVSVLTGDDIQRSGVTGIPEALRFVPGVQVARMTTHQWGISIRGFNEIFADKLLVLVDGRSVYTPLFSGTFWDYQDIPLESVDRIEVVRGPGASVWGANAMNGVINIITKSARENRGGTLSLGGGTVDDFVAETGYGVAVADDAWLRLDANYRRTGEMESVDGGGNGDQAQSGTGRLRLDWAPSDTSEFTLIGGGQLAEFDEHLNLVDLSIPAYVPAEFRVPSANGSLLGRWTRTFDERSQLEVQSYADYSEFDTGWLHDQRENFDVELNHRWRPSERHDVNWGLDYRLNADHIKSAGNPITISKVERSVNLVSGYLQDDLSIVPDVLTGTAGVRLEQNDYTGFEVQPTLRGLWKITEDQSVWASASRAVRTPSRAERDAVVNLSLVPPGVVHPTLPGQIVYSGSDTFRSEDLWAFELGYRWKAEERLHFDVTAFFNVYDHLRGNRAGAPYPNDPNQPTYVIVPLTAVNDTSGNTWGGELSAVWEAARDWRLQLGYSYLGFDLHGSDAADAEGWSPRHTVYLQSFAQLTDKIALDADVRFVDELSGPSIPAYFTADVRVGWKPRKSLELSVVGQNLFDSPHQEFRSSLIHYTPSLIERSVFGKITWSF